MDMMLQIDELSYIKTKNIHASKTTIIRVKRQPHNGKECWLITGKGLVPTTHKESLQQSQGGPENPESWESEEKDHKFTA